MSLDGESGNDDGPALVARFWFPNGIGQVRMVLNSRSLQVWSYSIDRTLSAHTTTTSFFINLNTDTERNHLED